MLRLQEKAHISLSEYQKLVASMGRHGSDPPTPIDENDELATLGGKTRLVAKREPSSPPLISLSPTTFNPVVPLPLSPSNQPHVHPNVVEYLRTFAPTPGPGHQNSISQQSSPHFADQTMYGMPSMPGSFNTDPNIFQQQHQQQHALSQPSLSSDNGTFPQYFPVYDYGLSGDPNGYPPMQMDNGMADLMTSPIQGRNSLTPETNMHTTWNEFVTGLGMQA